MTETLGDGAAVMGCFPTAAPKVAPPLNSKSSLSARKSLKKSAGFRAFISHMKLEGAMEARFLQTELESHLKEHCFLDSDDLRDLSLLLKHVALRMLLYTILKIQLYRLGLQLM